MTMICKLWRLLLICVTVQSSEMQDRLIKELFQGYDRLSRPVSQINQTVRVTFGITLNILVYVSDQDQVMKTNGYLDMTWTDERLKWDPEQYGGLSVLRLPVDKVWQPDIVLTNTVDGQFSPNYKSNALAYSGGTVQWVPPFIYKSGCDTNPHFFPFDHQLCNMVFRSVTYNADEVDIDLKEPKMELKDYCEQPSGTWDLAEVPLFKMYRMEWRRHGKVRMVFVQLDMKVARKSQFYVVTFLLPCVCIAFLTIFVFYLPAAAGEKICIGISILFTIVVFLLILTDILPPSDSLPLMTKFLVFTFVCNLTSVFITVITINWHYRTPEVYEMGKWTKLLWMDFLPRLLLMRRPVQKAKPKLFEPPSTQLSITDSPNSTIYTPHPTMLRRSKWSSRLSRSNSRKLTSQSSFEKMLPTSDRSSPIFSRVVSFPSPYRNTSALRKQHSQDAMLWRELTQLGQFLAGFPGYKEALDSVAFIAKSREEEFEEEDIADDWKYVALVIDRLLLFVFFVGNAFGSVSILLNSPHLFEPLTNHCPNQTTV